MNESLTRRPLFTIGKLATYSKVKVPTIRYYESEGLFTAVTRSAGNQRLYSDQELTRLNFIRHARDLGFSLDDIRDLISLQQGSDEPCTNAHRIVDQQLASVRTRLRRLKSLESELERMTGLYDSGSCKHCKIIESLSDHSFCMADHSKE